MMGRTYVCEICGGVFETTDSWTDEDANQEALKEFGVENASANPAFGVVCDVCYRECQQELRN